MYTLYLIMTNYTELILLSFNHNCPHGTWIKECNMYNNLAIAQTFCKGCIIFIKSFCDIGHSLTTAQARDSWLDYANSVLHGIFSNNTPPGSKLHVLFHYEKH